MTGPVVRLDFNELAPGARVSNQYFRHGVRITSHDPDHPAMVFDASAPTGGDDDLDAPELGHVLILSEDGDGGDPDDNAGGGVFRFDFDAPAEIRSLTLLDMEAGATVDLYGPDGVKLASRGIRTEDGAHADMTLDVAGVARMFVTLKGSGAIDNVIFAASPLGDGIVEGTDGDDIIDLVYAGDPEGDRIDSGDAILPGEDADDDIVLAEAGDDIVRAGAGDDEIFGGDGDDRLFGNGGDDAIQGQGGNDRIRGSGGDDVLDGGAGDDRVAGGRGDDRLFGGRGDDRLEGGAGVDIINAGADRDLIVGGTAGDIVNGGSGGDDFDTLDLTGTGLRRIDYDPNDPESGIVTFDDDTTMTFRDIEAIVPCFTSGTRIVTRRGEVAVEALELGDDVITRDSGICPIRWIGHRRLSIADLVTAPDLRPVRIRSGALGHGLPERDLIVSPQHRLLASGEANLVYFGSTDILVAAKHLVGRAGIDRLPPRDVTYIHIMFDRHEVVLSDGVWSESFRPGDVALRGLEAAQRDELLRLFPELATGSGRAAYACAHRSARRREAALLLR